MGQIVRCPIKGLHHNGNALGTAEIGLLVKLGRRAGIGGMVVGTFVILFSKFVFPTLDAKRAALFMFLTYGVAVAGLMIWMVQATKHRFLPLVLAAVCCVMAYFGWSQLHASWSTGPALVGIPFV
jgi:hypothetical protein